MNSTPAREDDAQPPMPPPPQAPAVAGVPAAPRALVYALVAALGLSLAASAVLWQRLGGIQEQLARQSADSGATAIEARTLAREAQELARDTAARQAVAETRLNEVTMQRTQLEELMQSLSRSRDENLAMDIEAALRLAQQQAQLTLSPEPLLAALRAADQRLARASQPRLARVRTALARDIDRVKAAGSADVPALLVRIDELTRSIDELPLANAVGAASQARAQASTAPAAPWWLRALDIARDEARSLVRVSRIDRPEAALLAPEQAFFLRENVKLKLLNARLSLLARQTDLARSDLASATDALQRYFDAGARRTQAAAGVLQQLQVQVRSVDLPRIDETLALLDATAAGR